MSLGVRDAVEAVRAEDARLRALVTPALEAALARDAMLAGVKNGPLHRVPYTLKDVWDVRGLPTTFGSWSRRDAIAPESGPVHRAFEAAGAVLIGKSNLSDLGLTPESASFVGGETRNPLDPSRTAGGSSGGAAAAVAASMAAFDWGTDFGGSIRLPAAFCGVVGMRLSRASWPVPGAASGVLARLNGMGPIARDLDTCRAVLEAAAPLRACGVAPPPFRGFLVLAPDRFSRGAWPAFEDDARAALAPIAPTWPAPLPPPKRIDDVFVGLLASHVGELARGRRGAALRALTVGRLVGDRRLHPASARVIAELSALRVLRDRDRGRALSAADDLARRADALFRMGFVIVTPTTTHPAPRLGRALSVRGLAAFVKLANLVDATALAVPFGRFDDGMPRSLQLLGPAGAEARLLDLAAALAIERRASPG